MPDVIDRDRKNTELAHKLQQGWMQWSDKEDPNDVSAEEVTLKDNLTDMALAQRNEGHGQVLSQFGAQETAQRSMLLFLMFWDDWTSMVGRNVRRRVEKFKEDQASDDPYRPPWEYSRGAGQKETCKDKGTCKDLQEGLARTRNAIDIAAPLL